MPWLRSTRSLSASASSSVVMTPPSAEVMFFVAYSEKHPMPN